MDKIFVYCEENKEYMRDQDYKQILDLIMEQKNKANLMRNKERTLKDKLHHLANDYIRMSKAFVDLVLERDGHVITNPLPSSSLDMEYELFSMTALPN
tara:strand:- start:764 stop:1057 length:294 start_codon:yes stop_codon:yes gene_type:complete